MNKPWARVSRTNSLRQHELEMFCMEEGLRWSSFFSNLVRLYKMRLNVNISRAGFLNIKCKGASNLGTSFSERNQITKHKCWNNVCLMTGGQLYMTEVHNETPRIYFLFSLSRSTFLFIIELVNEIHCNMYLTGTTDLILLVLSNLSFIFIYLLCLLCIFIFHLSLPSLHHFSPPPPSPLR